MSGYNEKRFDLDVRFQPKNNSSESSDIQRRAPTSEPKRDFEKVMKKKEDKSDSDQETVLNRKDATGSKGDDESGKQDTDSQQQNLQGQNQQSGAYAMLASRQGYIPDNSVEADRSEKQHTEFMQEQTDLTGIETQAAGKHGLQQIDENVAETFVAETFNAQQKTSISRVQEIVDQIVNKIYTLKQEGKTDTVLTLRHPPLFEGAQVKLTEFGSARGEFNITFSNLHPEAKALLDMQLAQNTLQKALEQRGYAAHIIVATTEDEQQITANDTGSAEKENPEHQDQQDEPQDEQNQKR